MSDTSPIVRLQAVSRRFGDTAALSDFTLDIPQGKVFGLVGENGAGKTTIVRHILGLLKAQTGLVRVFDLDPVADPVGVLSRVGYLSEDRDLPDWMTIDQLIGYTRAFHPDWNEVLERELIDQFELTRKQKIRSLSRGQRARTGLLLALAFRPELLLLDEPSSGLDAVVRQDILAAIIRTVADEGRTVVFSSHLLDEVQRVADRVAMLHRGQLILCDDLDNIISVHHRLTLRFNDIPTVRPVIDGAIDVTGNDREWTCLCNGGLDRVRASVSQLGATIVDEATPSLEEIFVSRVRGER